MKGLDIRKILKPTRGLLVRDEIVDRDDAHFEPIENPRQPPRRTRTPMIRNSTPFPENSNNRSVKSLFMFLRHPGTALERQIPDGHHPVFHAAIEPGSIDRLFAALQPRDGDDAVAHPVIMAQPGAAPAPESGALRCAEGCAAPAEVFGHSRGHGP